MRREEDGGARAPWARFRAYGARGGTAVALAISGVMLTAPITGVGVASAAPAATTTAPFNECPAIGADTSCTLLVVVSDNGISILGDPSQGPYDGADDTLVGVLNESSHPVSSLQLRSPSANSIFGFDSDGICTYATGGFSSNGTSGSGYVGDSYCNASQLEGLDPGGTFDPFGADYQGPDNTFSNISSDFTSGEVDFDAPLTAGSSTYFSLEDLLTTGDVGPQSGYYEAASDGGIFAYDAPFFGSMGGMPLNKPVVGIVSTPDHQGYWEVASDGGLFAFGDAGFYGSTGGQHLNSPIVGMAATPDGHGYWEVAADGSIFTFGDAAFLGSMGAVHLNAPVVGIASTPDGHGYWEVASDGGIFNFGDATFQGSMGGTPLVQPVVGITSDPVTGGYWEVAADGGLFAFNAPFLGSTGGMPLNKPVVGMAATPDSQGYWESATDGGIFSYGDAVFWGSTGSIILNAPVVGIAAGG